MRAKFRATMVSAVAPHRPVRCFFSSLLSPSFFLGAAPGRALGADPAAGAFGPDGAGLHRLGPVKNGFTAIRLRLLQQLLACGVNG